MTIRSTSVEARIANPRWTKLCAKVDDGRMTVRAMERHERLRSTEYWRRPRTTDEKAHARTGRRARQAGICGFGARLFRGGLPFAVCPKRYSVQEPKRDQTHTNRVNTNRKWMRGLWEEAKNQGPDCARCVSLPILFMCSVWKSNVRIQRSRQEDEGSY